MRNYIGLMALTIASAMAPSQAQIAKGVTLVVGYSTGGSADLVARTIAAELTKRISEPVTVENIVGSSGMLAVQKVLAAPADGRIIYMGGTDTVVVPMVSTKVKHRWNSDFQAIGRMTTIPMVFAVPGNSAYATLDDMVADVRKKPANSFNFATPGVGTMQHLYGALINKRAKVSMQHVPYRGGTQIVGDLASGGIESAVLVMSTALPYLKDGKIKALSLSDASDVQQVRGIKRIGEERGFDGVSLPLWQALFVKAGTPAAASSRYEKALFESLAQPEVKAKLAAAGITAAPLHGKETTDFIRQQQDLYRDIVTTANISVD